MPEEYVDIIKDMYSGCRTEVSTACGRTRQFQVEVGLHQGSALSPLLFALCVDVVTEEVREEARRACCTPMTFCCVLRVGKTCKQNWRGGGQHWRVEVCDLAV